MSTVPPVDQGPPGPPFTSWKRLGLSPDAGLFVQRDDQLFIRTRASLAVRVNVAVRLQQADDGRIVPQLFDLVTVADRSEQMALFGMAEGYLLGAAGFTVDAAMEEGAVFLEAGIIRGGAGVIARVQVLFSGYLGQTDALSWPGVVHEGAHAAIGRVRLILGADPAAGAESVETVPAGAHWELWTWRASLVTNATVAARRVHLVLDDGANIILDLAADTDQTASLTRNYNMARWGFAPTGTGTELYIPAPFSIHLEAGYRIRTLTTNLQAGDNWSAPRYQVLEQLVP